MFMTNLIALFLAKCVCMRAAESQSVGAGIAHFVHVGDGQNKTSPGEGGGR
jgi:hypothetical protein